MSSIHVNRVYQISDNEFEKLVKENTSYNQIIRNLNLSPCGAANKAVKKRISDLKCSTKHFKLQIISGTIPEMPLEKQLIENSISCRSSLKKKLFKHNLLKEECSKCFQGPLWNNEKLALQLDHINGIHNDNRLENLRILCPNCHSQTNTFSGKNNKKEHVCEICSSPTKGYGKNCKKCSSKSQKKKLLISKEELQNLIWVVPASQIAKKYKVSDKLIEKKCKEFGLSKPPRGYWTKFKF